jgi:hypothetical protein
VIVIEPFEGLKIRRFKVHRFSDFTKMGRNSLQAKGSRLKIEG